MTLRTRIQCMRSVSVRRGFFDKHCKRGSIRQGTPKRFRTAVAARTSVPFCTLQDLNIISMSASTGCGRGAQATGKTGSGTDLEAARRLGAEPSRAMLFEDSLIGVEAGKRGGFGCFVGIDHGPTRGVTTARRRCRHQRLARSAYESSQLARIRPWHRIINEPTYSARWQAPRRSSAQVGASTFE